MNYKNMTSEQPSEPNLITNVTDPCPADGHSSHCTHWTQLGEQCCLCDGLQPHAHIIALIERYLDRVDAKGRET